MFPGQGFLQSIQTFFTGPVALAMSLVATVVCGVGMSHGDHDAKRKLMPFAIGAFMCLTASAICTYIQSQS